MHRPWAIRSRVKIARLGAEAQQAGRDRKHSETDENAKPPVDMRAEKANDEPGYRHAQRAGTVAG
jgi:hypothetical protein